METHPAHDEGDPAGFKIKDNLRNCFLMILFIVVASCNQAKKNKKIQQPVISAIDSSEIKKQQQHISDSLAKVSLHKKKIYLTFDDGPGRGTINVLNAAKEDSIPVTFFIVGINLFHRPEHAATWQLLKADSSIELCNHSYSHALSHYNEYYRHPGAVVKDIERNKEMLGFNTNVVRMPGRNAWRIGDVNRTDLIESAAAIDSVHKAGFAVIGWDLELTYNQKKLSRKSYPGLLLQQIQKKLASGKTRTPGHLVLLAHDFAFQSKASIQQLHYIFRQLKNNPEYELVLAGRYPGAK